MVAPITADEVDDAVAYFTGVTPLRYATADGVADQAATEVLAGLGENYVDRNLAASAATTVTPATAGTVRIAGRHRSADPGGGGRRGSAGRPVARRRVPGSGGRTSLLAASYRPRAVSARSTAASASLILVW